MPFRRLGRLALATALTIACGSASDPVILDLDGRVVRRSEFLRHLSALEARGGGLSPEVRAALLERFLEERVLVLEARARGLLAEGATEADEREAVRRLLAEGPQAGLSVDEAEVAAHFEAHRQEYAVGESVSLHQVLLPTGEAAREVLAALRERPERFEELARNRSVGPEAASGGFMGVFGRGQLPTELEGPAFSLPVGRVSEVVTSPLGYHVLRVDARQSAREPELGEVRERVRAEMTREKSDLAVHRYVRSLIGRAKVNHAAAQGHRTRS